MQKDLEKAVEMVDQLDILTFANWETEVQNNTLIVRARTGKKQVVTDKKEFHFPYEFESFQRWWNEKMWMAEHPQGMQLKRIREGDLPKPRPSNPKMI